MRVRRLQRSLTVTFAWMGLLLLIPPAPAVALTVDPDASLMSSQCSNRNNPYDWRADLPYDDSWWTQYEQTEGTVWWCVYWYKVVDEDPNGDYYVTSAEVFWTTTQDYNGHFPPDARGIVRLSSDIAAKDHVYKSMPDRNIKLNESCRDFSVGVAIGFVGLSGSERFCEGGKLNLSKVTRRVARWASPDVTLTERWEVAYLQKVGEGKKPLLTARLKFPRYNIFRDPDTLYWDYTRAYGQVVVSYRVR